MTRVSVVGAGYVGLVTSACLADRGHQVVCVDLDPEKISMINRGDSPIHERGLPELLARNVGSNLCATTNLADAVQNSDVTLIAVGTPTKEGDIDLTYVRQASREVGSALRAKDDYHLVAVRSTVVPGTTDEVVRPILEESSGKRATLDFGLCMNPEFLTEGVAVRDFMSPDRIVLGGIDDRSRDVLGQLYASFEGVPKLRTTNKTAEMIKYVSNALLATLISFSNEIGNLCATLGDVDIVDVMNAIHINSYLSCPAPDGHRSPAPITSFLEAGCGFGGSCLPKDVKALASHGWKAGAPMRLLDAVMNVNEQQHLQVIRLLAKHFPSLSGVRVAVLGLAFKPDTDDVRMSPAIPIIEALLSRGARVQAYDPVANNEARKLFGISVALCDDLVVVLENAQAVILVTRWQEFERVPELLAQSNAQPVLVDGRRMLDRRSVVRYEGIGWRSVYSGDASHRPLG